MSRRTQLRHFALIMILFTFLAAGTIISCREQKKEENTEEQAEHPEGEEHPNEEGEHPEGEEHPEGGEHPEGEEHPTKDSVSG